MRFFKARKISVLIFFGLMLFISLNSYAETVDEQTQPVEQSDGSAVIDTTDTSPSDLPTDQPLDLSSDSMNSLSSGLSGPSEGGQGPSLMLPPGSTDATDTASATPDLFTGTLSYSFPIDVPPGAKRNGPRTRPSL